MSFHHLNRAIAIAAEAHAGQTDRGGQPYIFHPLRVMAAVPASEEVRIVAVLHDVLEDCPEWTPVRLRGEGYSETVIEALLSVTRQEGETYDAFVARAGRNLIGREVKMADLRDNMDLNRLKKPLSEADWDRQMKYHRALASLLA
jgi:(p)ppGpp synthase/HD superfamily hydrolase